MYIFLEFPLQTCQTWIPTGNVFNRPTVIWKSDLYWTIVFNIICSYCDKYLLTWLLSMPIPVAARSKAWFCGRSLASCEFESRLGHECLPVVSFVCRQVVVSATGWSPVQTNPTECGVSEFDRETATKRRPRTTRRWRATKKKMKAIKQKLFILAYQLLVTLGCLSGQNASREGRRAAAKWKHWHTRHVISASMALPQLDALLCRKYVACRKIPVNGYVTSGCHSTYFQYLAEITADSAQVYVVSWFPSWRNISDQKQSSCIK